jgi:hypothetical protein
MSDATVTMIAMLLSSPFVSLFFAVIVSVSTKIIAKFYPPFGMAYKATLAAVVITILLGYLADIAISSASSMAWVFTLTTTLLMGFFVKLFVYSRLIANQPSGAIGLKKSLQIASMQMLCEVAVVCMLGWFFIPEYMGYVEHVRQNAASKPSAKPLMLEQNKL